MQADIDDSFFFQGVTSGEFDSMNAEAGSIYVMETSQPSEQMAELTIANMTLSACLFHRGGRINSWHQPSGVRGSRESCRRHCGRTTRD